MNSVFGFAQWIASPVTGGARTHPPAPYFRQTFAVAGPVKNARLIITALGLYEAEINGRRIGDLVFTPGWTEYKKRVQYQIYDVTENLRQGENSLGAILGEGWYSGKVGFTQERQRYGERPQMLARLEITYRDGLVKEIVTDSNWKTSTGPILQNDFQDGETYDARLELNGWSQAGYDDRGWVAAVPAANPGIEFTLSDGPPVRQREELPASRLNQGTEPRLYDLKQNFSGWVRIKLRAARGTTATLRFGEILDQTGALYTENLRSARATDHYTAKGDPAGETWQPHFTFHGFRYVEVSGLKESDEFELTGVALYSDMKLTGAFSCSNPLLNQLQHNIVWGQKSNFLEVPTDCPQRDERLGWTGDAQIFVRTAAFNMDVQGFFRKWTRDIVDSQFEDGAIPPVVPQVDFSGFTDGGPAWADAAIICPWTMYLCYGDRDILADSFDMMRRFFDFTLKERTRDFIRGHPDLALWGGFGDWLALDGGGKTEGITPKDLIGTAFLAYDADLLAQICEVLGRPADARRYQALHRKTVAAFQRRFVTPDGLVVSGTQTAHVLALHFGLLAERHRPVVTQALVKDIEERGFHLATGFVGTPYLLDVLETNGRLDIAYRLLEQETFPSWLFPVKNGATTIWERWDGWTAEKGPQHKEMNSYNHYAYGAVGAWMVCSVAGLDLDVTEPGYRHIIFRPRPGGSLAWAKAVLETSYGPTRIHWALGKSGLKLDLLVPKGARATLQPPPGFGAVQKLGPGRHRMTLKKV